MQDSDKNRTGESTAPPLGSQSDGDKIEIAANSTVDESTNVPTETPLLVNGDTKPNDGGASGHPYDDASPVEGAATIHVGGDDDERNEKRGIARSKPPSKLRFLNTPRPIGGKPSSGLYPGRPAGPISLPWQQHQQAHPQQQHNWQHYIQNQQRLGGYMTQYPQYAAANASPYLWRGIAATAQPATGTGAVSSIYPVMRPTSLHHTPATHQPVEQLSTTNIYIRALSPTTTDHDLQEMCQEFGEISSVKAIINKSTGDCKGYGFVDFASAEDARKALEQLKTRKIQAQFAKLTPNDPRWKRLQETDPTNLYIQNLPKYLDEKGLENLLAPYGKVVSTRILKEQGSSLSKGVGFARMSAQSECEAIINKFNGSVMSGSEQPLVCKFADAASARRRFHPEQRRSSGEAELTSQDLMMSNRMAGGGGGQSRPLPAPLMSSYVPGIPQGAYQMASGQGSWITSPQGYLPVQPSIPTSSVAAAVQNPQDSLTGSYAPAAMVPQLTAQMQHLQLSQTPNQPVQHQQPQPIYVTMTNSQQPAAPYPSTAAVAAPIQAAHQQTHHHASWPVAAATAAPHSLISSIPQTEDNIGLIHAAVTSAQETSGSGGGGGPSVPTSSEHHLSHSIPQQQGQSNPSSAENPATAAPLYLDEASMGHHIPVQYSFSPSGQVPPQPPPPQHTAWPAT